MMHTCVRSLLLFALVCAAMAAEVEVITLSDGRVLTGVYDDEAQTITLSGPMAATIRVTAAQIVSRAPAGTTAAKPAAGDGPGEAMAMPGSQVDPAVLAPLIASSVPWEQGDRILIIGDLLVASGQPELALRIQDALTTGVPGKELVVFSMQNHGLTLERVAAAARDEIARRPPRLVLVLAGVGDVVALLPPPAKPVPQPKPVAKPVTPPPPPAPPAVLPLPSAEAWRTQLADLVAAAQKAGAAVVIATPANVGDKPADGPGFRELEAYAEVARIVASDSKAGLCDLRTALLARLGERNPKGSRELGVLSKAMGQLKPEAMDICAGLVAKALAEAVPRIPWTIDLPGAVFAGTTTIALRAQRTATDQVAWHVTTDGSEPALGAPSPATLALDHTALVRVLAVAKDGSQRRAQAWYMATASHAADTAPVETQPGLWLDHAVIDEWGDGQPSFAKVTADVETWWPNCELGFLDRLAVRPRTLSCLRYSGYFIAPIDGTYVFALDSDGPARVFLGAVPVVGLDRDGAVRSRQGAVRLAKGHHAFALYYGQGAGTPSLGLQVAEPGRRLRPLPDLLLCRPTQKPDGAGPAAVIDAVNGPGDPAAPWAVRLTGRAFTGSTKVEVETLRIAPERLNIYYTTDGTEPTDKSPLYTKTITVGSTTQIRVLATNKAGDVKNTAEAWYAETKKHAADAAPAETLSGLWTEHMTLKKWVDPVASIDTMKANFISWWPTGELSAFSSVPVHRWPNELFGMRWSGWFLAPVDGTYVFATFSDDATRIAMGPVAVLRNDDMHPGRWQYGAVELTKGFHQLGLLYGQGPAIYTMEVYVGLSGQRLQRLPDLLLRRSIQPPVRKGLAVEPEEPAEAAGQP